MIRTKARIKNKWTGETFHVEVPRGVRVGSPHYLIVTSVIEEEDGTPPIGISDNSPLPLEYLYAMRKEIHAFQAWAEKAGVGVDLNKIAQMLEQGADKCEQCGGWLLYRPVAGSGPSASPAPQEQPPSSSSESQSG